MIFNPPLVPATLIKRYKRFLVDVTLNDGSVVTVHCNNTGSMMGCCTSGSEIYLSPSIGSKRKTAFSWEMIKVDDSWVGINTQLPNALVYEAVDNKTVKGLDMYDTVFREVKFGTSRFDVMAQNDSECCVIEVKNVTLKQDNRALFPDAVTERGKKHLQMLTELKKEGIRAVMVYLVQRTDVSCFNIATHIDPEYAKEFKNAVSQGVEVFVLQAKVTPTQISIIGTLPLG